MCFFVTAYGSSYQKNGRKVVISTDIKPYTYLVDIVFAAIPKSPSQQESRMIVLRAETKPAMFLHDPIVAWVLLLKCLYIFLSSCRTEMRRDYKSQVE
jgi:hypothetical protein